MVLQQPVEKVIKALGHDGSEILWPEYGDPYCRRGFHPQELIRYAYNLGKQVISFEAQPVSIGTYDIDKPFEVPIGGWNEILKMEIGVLVGTMCNKQHAVVWDGERIVDTDGIFYPLRKMNAHTFFAVK